jgi:hypothetical protein
MWLSLITFGVSFGMQGEDLEYLTEANVAVLDYI